MRIAVLTGGSNGIGFSVLKELALKNYTVYNIDIKELDESIKNVITIKEDINNVNEIVNKLKDVKKIDLLINNAAIQIEKPFIKHTNDEIDKVMNTNIVSLVKLTNNLLPKMNKNSHIINVSSVHGKLPRRNKITYDISKAALEMFTKELALELAPNIRVNAISIGATKTPMNNMFSNKEHLDNSIKKVPLNYILKPEDVAKVIMNLISKDFKYLTGSIITYDGGRSLYWKL